MSERKETCGNCRFYDKLHSGWSAVCKRFPPQVVAVPALPSGTEYRDVFPKALANGWCGEWREQA